MATATPKLALRPFLQEDTPLLAEIFRESVLELTSEDYSESQQEAWVAAVDDLEAFARRLGNQLTLIATLDGSPVAFSSLAGNAKIDMMFVHPAAVGQGAARSLLDALEKLAGARGAEKLTVDASDTARGFFEKHGYIAQQRNSFSVGDEWLANTTLSKTLAKPFAAKPEA